MASRRLLAHRVYVCSSSLKNCIPRFKFDLKMFRNKSTPRSDSPGSTRRVNRAISKLSIEWRPSDVEFIRSAVSSRRIAYTNWQKSLNDMEVESIAAESSAARRAERYPWLGETDSNKKC